MSYALWFHENVCKRVVCIAVLTDINDKVSNVAVSILLLDWLRTCKIKGTQNDCFLVQPLSLEK